MNHQLLIRQPEVLDLSYPDHGYSSRFTSEIHQLTEEWIAEYDCLSPDTRKKVSKANYGLLCAAIFPKASLETLIPLTRWMLWAFVFDDYFGPSPKPELRHVCREAINILSGKEVGPGEHVLYRQLAIVRDELKAISTPDWMKRFINDHRYYFQGMIMDVYSYKMEVSYPTVTQYLNIRDRLIGGFMVCDLVELLSGRPFSNLLVNRQEIQSLRLLATRLMIWDNDIFSYMKELQEGESMNIVLVYINERQLSLEEAIEKAKRRRAKDLDEMLQLKENLFDFGNSRRQAEQYIDDMFVLLKGQLDWYQHLSYRYH